MAVDLELQEPPWRIVDATIISTARVLRRAYDVRLAALGLNLSEARVVAYVNDFGPEIQTRLADRLGVGRAAVGQLIDRLEGDGLVSRTRDTQDRRVWRVSKTRQTQKLRDEIMAIGVALREELTAGTTHDERTAMVKTLVQIQSNVTRLLDAHEQDVANTA